MTIEEKTSTRVNALCSKVVFNNILLFFKINFNISVGVFGPLKKPQHVLDTTQTVFLVKAALQTRKIIILILIHSHVKWRASRLLT